MREIRMRILSGLVYVSLFILAILWDAKSYISLVALFSMIVLWEFLNLIQFKKWFWALGLLGVILFYVIGNQLSKIQLLFLILSLLIGSLYLIYNLYFGKSQYFYRPLAKFFGAIIYVILPFSFLILLPFSYQRGHPSYLTEDYRPELIIYVLLIIWTNDSFAYFTGKSFGRRPLFKSVSPKKTVEGFFGGFVFSSIVACFLGIYNGYFGLSSCLIIATIIVVFGTFGDLIASKFKRQAGVKDSGKLLPGHGGLLDRLDSLFFATPFVYLYVHFLV